VSIVSSGGLGLGGSRSDARLVSDETFGCDPVGGHRRVIAIVVTVGHR
jgi:hypothetical protein